MFSTPENLLVEIYGVLGIERKPLSKQKCVFEKMQWSISEPLWMLELSNVCHCVQHPWKLTSRDFWSSRNKGKSLSKLNMFSENAVKYLRTLWMLELSNLCHCVQHPWKLTSRDFWSSRNERKALSQQKHVFRKCSGVSLNTVNARAFKPLPLCSAPLKTY